MPATNLKVLHRRGFRPPGAPSSRAGTGPMSPPCHQATSPSPSHQCAGHAVTPSLPLKSTSFLPPRIVGLDRQTVPSGGAKGVLNHERQRHRRPVSHGMNRQMVQDGLRK